ncbi:glycosyltransferase family 2 protein [Rossellomorea marisflavi]|uniref:glycosyltransferase family 2 protein n=1 Tax=Rossellomorea marisflavi TaxID=189381 RepID=UPI002852FBA3|nr:glycosyltransferase family 2 protein [Rossellomorea marisflavi]MDR4935303.1 glycosyltransferase family 2 protein [Rossellomorea marisflavi]
MDNQEKPMAKVSIIVPTYNTEEFLKECIDSIIGQTFKFFEIIIVDNGSDDNSFQIAQQLSATYDFVRSYRYPEGGVGGARNFGISKATSDYLMFIDGDDVIAQDALENLYAKVFENPGIDVVVGNLVKYRRDGISYFPEFQLIHSREIVINSIKEFHVLLKSQTPTNKLFRREHLETNKLRFPESLVHEDLYFTTLAVVTSKKTAIIKDVVYYYRKFEQESITLKDNEPYYFKDRLTILKMVDDYLTDNGQLDLKEFIDRYKLDKFFVPMERKFFNVYSDDLTVEYLDLLHDQLASIDHELIRDVNRNVAQYIFIKEGLYKEYEEWKKKGRIKARVDNGKLFLNSPQLNLPDRFLDVTPMFKSMPLKYEVEDINVVNNIYTVKGYAYVDGIKAERNHLEVLELYLMNYDHQEEKNYFNMTRINRYDLVYSDDAPAQSGFEASLDLNKVEKWNSKNFKIYVKYYYAGVEKIEQIQIAPYKLFELRKTLSEDTVWRLTNISKNYFQAHIANQKQGLQRNISTKTTNIVVDKKPEKKKTIKKEKPVQKPIEVHLKKQMITFDKGQCTIDFSEYPSINGENIKVINRNGDSISEGVVKKNSVKLSIPEKLFALRYVDIKSTNQKLVKIRTNKLLNIKKIQKKRKIISKFVFNEDTTPFGCYIFYKKFR